MRPADLINALQGLLEEKVAVLLVGPPGVGKTEVLKQAVRKKGWDILITHPVVDQPIDYKGLPSVHGGNAEFLPYGHLKKMINADKPLVVFLDDLGQAQVSVQAAAMQLVLERSIGDHKVSDHVRFVAATNRKQDRAGVQGLIEPLKSRMIIIDYDVSAQDWIDWALENDIPPSLVSFIEFKPSLLFDFKPTPEIKNFPCPRTIAHAGMLMKHFIDQDNMLFEVVKGCAGEGFATEFLSYMKLRRELPSIPVLIEDDNIRSEFKAPKKPDINYVLVGALTEYATKKNIGKILQIVDKLEKEYKVCAVNMISRRDKKKPSDQKVMRTKEAMIWLSKNADIMMREA